MFYSPTVTDLNRQYREAREKLLAHLRTLPLERLQPFAQDLLLDFPELFWEGKLTQLF